MNDVDSAHKDLHNAKQNKYNCATHVFRWDNDQILT